jgi:predicted nuclease of predicted toxin-antitoxin system
MVMPRKTAYLRQKPILCFDENFPQQIIDAAKSGGPLRNSFKLLSVFDFNNQGRDDQFQLGFCKAKDFVLVTLDKDFMDDRRFPIQNLPGIIVVAAAKNQPAEILACLTTLARFISFFPRPKGFMGDCKFQVSSGGCIIRGRNARTRVIKTVVVKPGDRVNQIAREFGFY